MVSVMPVKAPGDPKSAIELILQCERPVRLGNRFEISGTMWDRAYETGRALRKLEVGERVQDETEVRLKEGTSGVVGGAIGGCREGGKWT